MIPQVRVAVRPNGGILVGNECQAGQSLEEIAAGFRAARAENRGGSRRRHGTDLRDLPDCAAGTSGAGDSGRAGDFGDGICLGAAVAAKGARVGRQSPECVQAVGGLRRGSGGAFTVCGVEHKVKLAAVLRAALHGRDRRRSWSGPERERSGRRCGPENPPARRGRGQ